MHQDNALIIGLKGKVKAIGANLMERIVANEGPMATIK